MKKIKVLGSCCSKCGEATRIIEAAIREKNLNAEVEKVEEMSEIMQYDVLSTPAIVVDEEVKMKGKVPTAADVKSWFDEE
jgi:small redox-active disulfide protein 2